jgi:beta-phosphoglucomutase-like phosphatase (HAD superfamily)
MLFPVVDLALDTTVEHLVALLAFLHRVRGLVSASSTSEFTHRHTLKQTSLALLIRFIGQTDVPEFIKSDTHN